MHHLCLHNLTTMSSVLKKTYHKNLNCHWLFTNSHKIDECRADIARPPGTFKASVYRPQRSDLQTLKNGLYQYHDESLNHLELIDEYIGCQVFGFTEQHLKHARIGGKREQFPLLVELRSCVNLEIISKKKCKFSSCTTIMYIDE